MFRRTITASAMALAAAATPAGEPYRARVPCHADSSVGRAWVEDCVAPAHGPDRKCQTCPSAAGPQAMAATQHMAAPQGMAYPQGAPVSPAHPVGMYAQPQATGEYVGESHSLGIRGLSVTLPEITVQLPSVQLPSFFSSRRGPEFRSQAASAPFVHNPPAVYGQMAAGGNAYAATPVAASYGFQPTGMIATQATQTQMAAVMQPASTVASQGVQIQLAPAMHPADRPAPASEQPPVPPAMPTYPQQSPPCVDDQSMPCENTSPASGLMPNTGTAGEMFLPPPPAPPTDPAVSELGRLRQQIALQQQVIAELQKSMELTQRSLSALELAPGEFSESSPSGSIEMRSGQGVIRPVQYRHQFEQGSQRTVNSAESSGRPGRGRVSAP